MSLACDCRLNLERQNNLFSPSKPDSSASISGSLSTLVCSVLTLLGLTCILIQIINKCVIFTENKTITGKHKAVCICVCLQYLNLISATFHCF